MVRGRISDSSGSIGFLSWKEFGHEEGALVKIVGASVRKFRDTPEIQINDGTVIETYRDSLPGGSRVSGIREGQHFRS